LFRRSVTVLAIAAAVTLLAGCPLRSGSGGVRAGGMSIRPGVDPLIGLASYTDDDVLRLADEAFDLHRYDRSYALYARYIQEFPDAPGRHAARFNAALSAERFGLYEEAIALYERYLLDSHNDGDRVTTRYRLVACLIGAGRWDEALEHIDHLLGRLDTVTVDRFELRVQRAWVVAAAGEPEAGEEQLRALVGRYRVDRGRTLGGYQGAMAQYHLGEIYRLQAEGVALVHVDDLEQARAELNRKAELILAAQDCYLAAIKIGVHEWIPRSGYRLGGLYEQFRRDILAAQYPEGVVTAEDRLIYREILNEQTAVLLLKARAVYQKVLTKAAEVNIHDEWIVRLLDNLKKLEGELLAESLAVDI
jgi:tetratricopeptide (TPR) repeat protein